MKNKMTVFSCLCVFILLETIALVCANILIGKYNIPALVCTNCFIGLVLISTTILLFLCILFIKKDEETLKRERRYERLITLFSLLPLECKKDNANFSFQIDETKKEEIKIIFKNE